MKISKKMKALALCVLLCMSLVLGACGEKQAPAQAASGAEAEYTVTVVDGSGKPYTSGIIVQFMANGEKVALQTINENGIASKTLAKGERSDYVSRLQARLYALGYLSKTGSLTGCLCNDAGVVYTPKGDYAIVTFYNGNVGTEEEYWREGSYRNGEELLAQVSKAVYDIYMEA